MHCFTVGWFRIDSNASGDLGWARNMWKYNAISAADHPGACRLLALRGAKRGGRALARMANHIPVFSNMGPHMKTTIEINDELFRSARQRAADTGTTLRALVEEGLRSVLARVSEPPAVASFQVRVFRCPAGDSGLVAPYDRLGLHHAILDTYRQADGEGYAPGAVHDRD